MNVVKYEIPNNVKWKNFLTKEFYFQVPNRSTCASMSNLKNGFQSCFTPPQKWFYCSEGEELSSSNASAHSVRRFRGLTLADTFKSWKNIYYLLSHYTWLLSFFPSVSALIYVSFSSLHQHRRLSISIFLFEAIYTCN